MPRYDYACHACDHRFEAVHPIASEALSVCPECSGTLRRVIGAVGVSFKGSGFYQTDTREAARKGRAKATSPSSPASASTPSTATPSTAPPSTASSTASPSSTTPSSGSAPTPARVTAAAAAPAKAPAGASAAKTSSAPSSSHS